MEVSVDDKILKKAESWLDTSFDEETRKKVQHLINHDQAELAESFYTDLEFGTGGLRGIMGVGTNRINKYTIGMATQGLANYLKSAFDEEISVAIAFDSRNKSDYYAEVTANVFSANGIKVYLFDALRPTPELSFAIRHLGCKSGVVITASHNPKVYNGYKVYWKDGGQIVDPHDKNIITEVQKISSIAEVRFDGNPELIQKIGEDIDNAYLHKISGLSLSPDAISANSDLKIVFTSLHGTGITLLPTALERAGFENVSIVERQKEPDGEFPTVVSPNPEEKAAMDMALEQAQKEKADLVLGTDPDGDRVGLAVRVSESGAYQLLNGNETAVLLVYYQLKRWKELGRIDGKQFVAKTVVTTELIDNIAEHFGVKVYDTLTGFKHIAAKMRELEGKETFITGGEESYGYLAGDFVRDKDAIISAVMICEIAAWAREQGMSIMDLLENIHREFGFFKEHLISVVRTGRAGKEEIEEMMKNFRQNPPEKLAGSEVVKVCDFESGKCKNLETDEESQLEQPQSNVMQFYTKDGSKVTARPSGTEPKIKFYFSVNKLLKEIDDYDQVKNQLEEKIAALTADFKSN